MTGTGETVGPSTPPRRDPLAGRAGWTRDLLAELSSSELDEHIAFWTEKHETARQQPGQGQRAWWSSKLAAGGTAERSRRRHAEAPGGSAS